MAVARSAAASYDLPADLELRPIRVLNNAVFEVIGGGCRCVLRVHRAGYRTAEEIRSELRVLEHTAADLEGSMVTVPRPITTRDGDRLVTVGDRHCDVLTWVDGRVLKHGSGLGPRSASLLGEGLARIHDAGRRVPRDLALPHWDARGLLSDASPFRPGPMRTFLDADAWSTFCTVEERVRQVFDELPDDQWGVIHNDFVLINCLFVRRRSGWQLGVLDFDDVGRGWLPYDLAPLLGNFFDWPTAYARLRRAFLDGYRSVRPFDRELERHLPVLMAARHAHVLTWLAAKQRRGETDVPVERLVAIRVVEMRRALGER